MVDGEVEKAYFEHIQINQKEHVRFTIRIGNEEEFLKIVDDEIPVIVILDIDGTTSKNNPKKRYHKILSLTANEKTKDQVFFNNYAFETFLLLHVTDFSRPVAYSTEYDGMMKQHFQLGESWTDHKHQQNIEKVLKKINKETLKKALERARLICEDCFKNPSSNMNRFFEKVNQYNLPVEGD